MTIRVLDPTAGEAAATASSRRRLATLKGKTVGFISNGKEAPRASSPSRPPAARGARRGQGGEPHQDQLQRAGRQAHSPTRSGNGRRHLGIGD